MKITDEMVSAGVEALAFEVHPDDVRRILKEAVGTIEPAGVGAETAPPSSHVVGSVATVSDHNAAYDPADDAFGGAFKDGFREGWLFASDPGFDNREELEGDYHHVVDIAPSECWDAYKETYFAMLPLAAIPEVGDPLPTPRDQMVGWQPMETAPLNGDRVDIWIEPHDAFESGNAHRRINAYFDRGDWWFRSNDGAKDLAASYHWKVAAWMPPPPPPAERVSPTSLKVDEQ